MPYEIAFLEQERVMAVRTFGRGSAEEGFRALKEVREHASYRQAVGVLVDIRELEWRGSSEEIRQFARTYGEEFPGNPIAFLTHPGVMYGLARATEEQASLHGATVMVFTDPAAALDWLRTTTISRD